ncbi:MAG: branched-chain amino acid ABC transporter permease [Rhodocyclaceae bacterium]|nr:branched-chain amino acid ABC transporter permease [Rhodocyclaceae bacterium]
MKRLPHLLLPVALGLFATTVPWWLAWLEQDYYLGLATRIVIYALAATSLNLLIGFSGMVGFGHAAFFGGAAYLSAYLTQYGWYSAWVAWPLSLAFTGVLATIIGLFSLRTRGVHFIMITLAFAQMIHYAIVAWPAAGGDDGLPLVQRSSLPPLDLADDRQLYWLALALTGAVLLALSYLARTPLGHAWIGIRENERRMAALGFPVLPMKLACFVVSSLIAGLAGILLVQQTGMASPTHLSWTTSGQLLVMALIGGAQRITGGVKGALILLLAEEWLAHLSAYPHFWIGLLLLALAFRGELARTILGEKGR